MSYLTAALQAYVDSYIYESSVNSETTEDVVFILVLISDKYIHVIDADVRNNKENNDNL